MKANILNTLRSLHNDESGQDLIEYALVASLIAFGAVTAMNALSTGLSSVFSAIGTSLKTNAKPQAG